MPIEVIVAPPAILLLHTRCELKPEIAVAAQNVCEKPNGAVTGEISVPMLKEHDIHWTILGHSERRQYYDETDEVH